MLEINDVRPLHDPLLAARPVIYGITGLAAILGIGAGLTVARSGSIESLIAMIGLALAIVVPLASLRMLPRQPVGALYLRSFREDAETFDARLVIEAVLHPDIRLAGIRSPRKRFPSFLRVAVLGVFVVQYLSSRFMNLEAGADWYARLWRSLQSVRAVVLDVREMTEHVRAEVDLVFACVDLRRVLVITDGQTPLPDGVHTVHWDENEVEAFTARVEAFKAQLPPGVSGERPETFALVQDAVLDPREHSRARVRDVVSWVAGSAGLIAMEVFLETLLTWPPAMFVVATVGAYPFWLFVTGLVAMFRRNPIAHSVKRRSRFLLFKSARTASWGLLVASLLSGAALVGVHYAGLGADEILEGSKDQATQVQLHQLNGLLRSYQIHNGGEYPDPATWQDQLLEARFADDSQRFVDRWGYPIVFELRGGEPYLFSVGRDGVAGTDDDVVRPSGR